MLNEISQCVLDTSVNNGGKCQSIEVWRIRFSYLATFASKPHTEPVQAQSIACGKKRFLLGP